MNDVSPSSGLFFVELPTQDEEVGAIEAWFQHVKKLQEQREKRLRQMREAADARKALAAALSNMQHVRKIMEEAEDMVYACQSWVDDVNDERAIDK